MTIPTNPANKPRYYREQLSNQAGYQTEKGHNDTTETKSIQAADT